MTKTEILNEISQKLNLVPEYFDGLPEEELETEWRKFQSETVSNNPSSSDTKKGTPAVTTEMCDNLSDMFVYSASPPDELSIQACEMLSDETRVLA